MKTKSFTLIELLVVIVIIGILAGVIIISTTSSISKANITKLKVFEESVKNSLLISLVSDWDFDNITDYDSTTKVVGSSSNNIIDSWGTNNGTAYNGPILKEGVDCVNKRCLYFNGTNYIVIDMPVSGIESTISLWVKNPVVYGYIFRSDANTRTYVHKSGSFSKGNPSTLVGTTNYSTEWTYVVMTWKKEDGQPKARAFVNGVALTSDFVNFLDDRDGTYITIMSLGRDGVEFSSGTVDEVRLFEETLTISQIKQEYIAGLNSLLSNGSISKDEYSQRIKLLAQK